MAPSLLAKPHIKLPTAKKTLENIRPVRREKISVNRPLSGWEAALAIRYPVANHERSENEWNEDEIGPVSVATTVVSSRISYSASSTTYDLQSIPKAARKTPTHTLPKIRITSFVVGSCTRWSWRSWNSGVALRPCSARSGVCSDTDVPRASRGFAVRFEVDWVEDILVLGRDSPGLVVNSTWVFGNVNRPLEAVTTSVRGLAVSHSA